MVVKGNFYLKKRKSVPRLGRGGGTSIILSKGPLGWPGGENRPFLSKGEKSASRPIWEESHFHLYKRGRVEKRKKKKGNGPSER